MPIAFARFIKNYLYRYRAAIIPEWRLGDFPFTQHLKAVFLERDIEVVLDVGANVGQFAQLLRNPVGFKGPIISFEPVSSSFALLSSLAESDHNWSVFQSALGSTSGASTINVTAASEFSSLLTPKIGNVFPEWSHVERREAVSVSRLDDFLCANHINPRRAYLKIDTQGFDLEVLKGAPITLNAVEAIQIELSMRPLYDGAPSYFQVLSELSGMGFAISTMFPINLTNMMAIEMDCILVRETPDDSRRTRTYASLLKSGILIPRRFGRRHWPR